MLDEKTLEWLRTREKEEYHNGYYFCDHSNTIRSAEWNNRTGWGDALWIVDIEEDYRDVAEFEARVGELLSIEQAPWQPCYMSGHCKISAYTTTENCMWCRMKHARLVVEEEMENARQKHAWMAGDTGKV